MRKIWRKKEPANPIRCGTHRDSHPGLLISLAPVSAKKTKNFSVCEHHCRICARVFDPIIGSFPPYTYDFVDCFLPYRDCCLICLCHVTFQSSLNIKGDLNDNQVLEEHNGIFIPHRQRPATRVSCCVISNFPSCG